MKIVITGGMGFVGFSLAISLKNAHPSYIITLLDNLLRRGSELNIATAKEMGIRFIHGDIRLKEDIEEIGDIDFIIDASADPSILSGITSSRTRSINNNLTGTLNLLEYAYKNEARFIFLSTSRVYSIASLLNIKLFENNSRFEIDPTNLIPGLTESGISESFDTIEAKSFYGAAKFCCEQIIQEYGEFGGMGAIINRCGVIAGPGQFGKVDQGVLTHWLMAHYWKKPLSYIGFGGQGKQVRDFLHIRDLADLIDYQINNFELYSGKTFNIGGGKSNSLSLLELTGYCQEITGNKFNIGSHPDTRPADVPWYITDSGYIKSVSGWEPKMNINNILNDTHIWMKENSKELKNIFS